MGLGIDDEVHPKDGEHDMSGYTAMSILRSKKTRIMSLPLTRAAIAGTLITPESESEKRDAKKPYSRMSLSRTLLYPHGGLGAELDVREFERRCGPKTGRSVCYCCCDLFHNTRACVLVLETQ